jgi:ABC-type polysaccharide transport system permease subunit
MKEVIVSLVVISSVMWNFVGLVVGGFNSIGSSCGYTTLAEYANPGYWAGCALFKQRYSKEEPCISR